MQVPFFSLGEINNTEVKSSFLSKAAALLDKGDFILGNAVTAFEQQYAHYSGTEHCIGVSNGLDALKLALRALGIGIGDEVIVPANTFIATFFAVADTGAIPVPLDPDPATYNITAATLSKVLTARTRAIIPVHLYGQPCNMDAIMQFAKQHSVYVLEDNAQAQGAEYNGKKTGSFGHINATSFYPSKNLGAFGDAGAITTNNVALAHKVRQLRNVGSDIKYKHELMGYNARLDSVQALALSCKLPYLNAQNKARRQAAARYINNLSGRRSIALPKTIEGAEHVYHLFVIRHEQRDKLQNYLTTHSIGTLIHYPVPPHLQSALKNLGYGIGAFPIAEEISNTCLSLPLFPGITEAQIDFVCEKIIDFEKEML